MHDIPDSSHPPHTRSRIAAFMHCYYPDLAPDLASVAVRMPAPCDIFISTDNSEKADLIHNAFHARHLAPQIRIFPNRGWDIAAFLVGFADIMPGYDLCLKIHGKKSPHYVYGDMWREFLFAELAHDAAYIQNIVARFADDPSLGMLAPAHWHRKARVCLPSPNHALLIPLLARMDIHLTPESSIDFPAGSMFWCRTQALAPLLNLGLDWDDFEPTDADAWDFSPAHALERAFFYSCEKSGLRWEYIPKYSSFTGNPYSPANCLAALFFLSRKFVHAIKTGGLRYSMHKTKKYLRKHIKPSL